MYAFSLHDGKLKWMNDLMPTFVAVSLAIYPFSIHGTGETYAILLVGLSGKILEQEEESNLIYMPGYLFALDCQNGSKRNSINLEGTGFKPIALLVDSRTDTLFTCISLLNYLNSLALAFSLLNYL